MSSYNRPGSGFFGPEFMKGASFTVISFQEVNFQADCWSREIQNGMIRYTAVRDEAGVRIQYAGGTVTGREYALGAEVFIDQNILHLP